MLPTSSFTGASCCPVHTGAGHRGEFFLHNHWNEFFTPLICLQSPDKWTMAIGLQSFKDLSSTSWILMMATSTAMIVPLLVLFFAAQKYFTQGIQMSGIAGR